MDNACDGASKLALGTPCDDSNACTSNDTCQAGGVCLGAVKLCDDATSVCYTNVCDSATGQCAPAVNVGAIGAPCDDGDACTTGETCNSGVCAGGTAIVCNNGSVCSSASCNKVTGCVFAINPAAVGTPCPNAGPCVTNSACTTGGKCVGVAVTNTVQLQPCQTVSCDPSTGNLTYGMAADGSACDDGDPCTKSDTCMKQQCAGTPLLCGGSQPCVADVCDPLKCTPGGGGAQVCGQCVAKAKVDGAACSDGDACTANDSCGGGVCLAGSPTTCDDGNPCTTDSCDKLLGCQHAFVTAGADCSPGACNLAATCNAIGQCITGVPGGLGPCETATCDVSNNSIVKSATADGTACLAPAACHQDAGACSGGVCVTPPVKCDDGDPCTTDSCAIGLSACVTVAAADTTNCDDGNPCTVTDTCTAGKCAGVGAKSCDDGESCTADSCDPASGCVHGNLTGPACNDGSLCTVTDACSAGACVGTGALACDDGDPCTTDGCSAGTGCTTAPASGAACDDKDACTVNDTCASGACQGGGATPCDDGNLCTDDSCNSQTGCVHANNTAPCTDGSVCTVGDTCSAGACIPGVQKSCDDGKSCTTDTCSAQNDCQHSNVTGPCTDNNVCTISDFCSNGACVPGTAKACSDGNACTADSCDPSVGCVNALMLDNSACDDGNACTLNDLCKGGTCTPGTAKNCDDGMLCTADTCAPATGVCDSSGYVANCGPTFNDVNTSIFKPMCASCHGTFTAAALVGQTAKAACALPKWVVKGQPLQSEIVMKVDTSIPLTAGCGGRMPQNNPGSVTATQSQQLKDWIANGAVP